MRKLLTLTIALLAAFVAEAHSLSNEWHSSCEVKNRYEEQLECCHRHNIDAERTSTLVVPSRTTTTNLTRQNHHRTSAFSAAERYASLTNYPAPAHIHRLGNGSHGLDSRIYIFCQLRL